MEFTLHIAWLVKRKTQQEKPILKHIIGGVVEQINPPELLHSLCQVPGGRAFLSGLDTKSSQEASSS